jgi:hypothetical protein
VGTMLYEPIKSFVPTIFPIILEKKSVIEEEVFENEA